MTDFQFAEPNPYHRALLRRWGWATRLRPLILGELFLRFALPGERRRIFVQADGTRLFLDPLSHAGRTIIEFGTLEADTEALLERYLHRGDAFIDVGANEGVLTVAAGRLVGETGIVVAVEPQSRLAGIIEINAKLNSDCEVVVVRGALGGSKGETAKLHLYPSLNTGASSIATRYRFARAAEVVPFIAFEEVLARSSRKKVDLVKIDVEGFEGHVVRSMAERLKVGSVRRLLVDYHTSQLTALGESAAEIDSFLTSLGMVRVDGELAGGYAVYEHQAE